eukprot:GHRR01036730.1.p1 GENE.GHRR01036730.1~~GHRR01036730.1.p1  ORF type:complete len:292 (+),score=108.66 GHRR01036730.1:506-1381(+)
MYADDYDTAGGYNGQGHYQVDEQKRPYGAIQDNQYQGDSWRESILQLAAAVGLAGQDPSPEAVVQEVLGLKQSAVQLQQQEAALQVQVAHLTLQNLELRRELGSGWAAAEPSVVQVRQLVLDPAIQHEFSRLRQELENHKATIAELREQVDSLTFTAESKMGRALIKKTKLLADENQEMAMQLKEGPAATQGALLALERHHANELRRGLSEIQDHCTYLEEENEELNMIRFLNERQIQDMQASAAPAAVGAGGIDGDGRLHHGGRGTLKRGMGHRDMGGGRYSIGRGGGGH